MGSVLTDDVKINEKIRENATSQCVLLGYCRSSVEQGSSREM